MTLTIIDKWNKIEKENYISVLSLHCDGNYKQSSEYSDSRVKRKRLRHIVTMMWLQHINWISGELPKTAIIERTPQHHFLTLRRLDGFPGRFGDRRIFSRPLYVIRNGAIFYQLKPSSEKRVLYHGKSRWTD